MKFLLDENVEYRIAVLLKQQGYDVTAITHEYPNALSDREVLAIAVKEKRILMHILPSTPAVNAIFV